MPRLLLHGLQSPINIGQIFRVAEVYDIDLIVFDKFAVFQSKEKLGVISDFACGAMQRRHVQNIVNPDELVSAIGAGRLIATTIEADALALPRFDWRQDDVVALGNEYDGLPDDLVQRAAQRINIPTPPAYLPKPPSLHPIDPTRAATVSRDGQPSLSVAISAGVIAYSAYLRFGYGLPNQ